MELFEKIEIAVITTSFVVFTVTTIIDLVKTNKEYRKYRAELKLYEGALCREHKMLKALQNYAEWLDTYHGLMYTNAKLEDSEFNKGVLMATGDIQDEFYKIFNEFVGNDNGREKTNNS